jgi:hypothetical protein
MQYFLQIFLDIGTDVGVTKLAIIGFYSYSSNNAELLVSCVFGDLFGSGNKL